MVIAARSLPESARSAGPTPLASTERSELRGILREALGELTELQREIVLLHDVEGWKHREIAELIGVAEGTVRAHLFHARRAMRETLGKELLGG